MPQKSKQTRERMAKSAGITATLKKSDLGREKALSGHAAKKSRHLASVMRATDRKVSPKRAPATGRKTAPSRSAAGAAAYKRSEAGAGRKPGRTTRRER